MAPAETQEILAQLKGLREEVAALADTLNAFAGPMLQRRRLEQSTASPEARELLYELIDTQKTCNSGLGLNR